MHLNHISNSVCRYWSFNSIDYARSKCLVKNQWKRSTVCPVFELSSQRYHHNSILDFKWSVVLPYPMRDWYSDDVQQHPPFCTSLHSDDIFKVLSRLEYWSIWAHSKYLALLPTQDNWDRRMKVVLSLLTLLFDRHYQRINENNKQNCYMSNSR